MIPNREHFDRDGFGKPHTRYSRARVRAVPFGSVLKRPARPIPEEHVVPVLSFPCAVHRLDPSSRPVTRRVWVKGHDFRALAIAATEQLGATPERCQYSLISPDTRQGPRSSLLEVTPVGGQDDADALLGPMASPLPTELLIDRRFALEELIELLGFERPLHDASLGDSGSLDDVAETAAMSCGLDRSCRQYQVIVTYSPICNWEPRLPKRRLREVDVRYSQRIDAAERVWIDRARYQGIYLLAYDVPPCEWRAEDLEKLLRVAYGFLPVTEPHWRESGSIITADFVNRFDLRDRRSRHPQPLTVVTAPCLRVGRGDYVAHVRLPAFPVLALADWIGSRDCDINLRHPMSRPDSSVELSRAAER